MNNQSLNLRDPFTRRFILAAGVICLVGVTGAALYTHHKTTPEDRAEWVALDLSKQCNIQIQREFLESKSITNCEKVKEFLLRKQKKPSMKEDLVP